MPVGGVNMPVKIQWILLSLVLLGLAVEGWACNKGGPLGFASGDPGALTVNISSSPTFSTMSSFGAGGCKQWKLFSYLEAEREMFLLREWQDFSEQSAQGQGKQIEVFTTLLGCSTDHTQVVGRVLRHHYREIFLQPASQAPENLSNIKRILHAEGTLYEVCNPWLYENQFEAAQKVG